MAKEIAIRRAQIYGFLADLFLYPRENWTEDITAVNQITNILNSAIKSLEPVQISLSGLQSAHRRTFGTAGSLCYETEYGLPHEYRQSQEMADIAGFYRAFGFNMGGAVRERPDHIAVELEFMHIMALKEAYALESGIPEHVEICIEAQGKFLQDHLGRWIDLFAQSVAHNAPDSLYEPLAKFAADFVVADAGRLGVTLKQSQLAEIHHTPFDPDFSCADCAVAGMGEQGFVPANSIVRNK